MDCHTTLEKAIVRDCVNCYTRYTENSNEDELFRTLSYTDDIKNNLFHIAAINRSINCLKLMLVYVNKLDECISIFFQINKCNRTPLMLALESGSNECANLLYDTISITPIIVYNSNTFDTTLLKVVRYNNFYILSKMLTPDINIKNIYDKYNILHYSVFHEDCECLKFILQHPRVKCLFEGKNYYWGYLAFEVAVEKNNVNALKLLMDFVEKYYGNEHILKFIAYESDFIISHALDNSLECLSLLLSRYKECRAQLLLKVTYYKSKFTSLAISIYNGKVKFALEILKYEEGQQSIKIKSGEGKDKQTILHYNLNIIIMREMSKYPQFYKILNKKDYNGNTPLHTAVMYNNDEELEFLLECGANYKIKNSSHETPLRLARGEGCKKSIKVLKKFIRDKKELEIKTPDVD